MQISNFYPRLTESESQGKNKESSIQVHFYQASFRNSCNGSYWYRSSIYTNTYIIFKMSAIETVYSDSSLTIEHLICAKYCLSF